MSSASQVVASPVLPTDSELVARVRDGEDAAFEELYRRYQRRIVAFVRRLVGDEARAEDVTQEAFFSALRRLRVTDSEIVFKPWIYEIARNAAIDQWRRSSRAEEVSINQDELLRPADRSRLVGGGSPDRALLEKERIDHLRRAMDELSQTHHRILVMRELEGLSYREIGERLELSRPAVESTLFRARRRLEREYEEIEAGRRCEAIELVIARISQGVQSQTDVRRLSRHACGCSNCRRHARQMGVEPLRSRQAIARAAAILPLPGFLRRRFSASEAASPPAADAGVLSNLVAPTAHVGAAMVERAAAFVAAVAIAGAGGAVIGVPGKSLTGPSPAGHHRGTAAGVHKTRVPAVQGRTPQRGAGSAPARRREWGPHARSGNTARTGKPRVQTPAGKAAPAPGLSPGHEIDAPDAPQIPAAPRVGLTPPAKPGLASPPASGLSAPAALPTSPASPHGDAGALGGLGAARI